MELVRDDIPVIKDNKEIIALSNFSATYVQEHDCTEDSDEYQTITFSVRNGGGGPFVNVKTEGWSYDDPKILLELAKDFQSRLELNTKLRDEF